MGDMSSAAAQHEEGVDALGPQLPPGRHLELPGRGTTFIRDLEVISPGSPLGRALVGRGAGETVEYEAPGGMLKVEIVEVA